MGPRVSVIIPTYNAASFIGQTIESVLAQTYPVYEIIVVDDGSTDNTEEVVRPYLRRIRYLREDNGGPARARNIGIAAAQGEYLAFLDADDLWLERKLQMQVALMDKHPQIGLCFTDGVLFDGVGEESITLCGKKTVLPKIPFVQEADGRVISRRIHEDLLYENFIVTASIMIRKAAMAGECWFDETLFSTEDFDLWFRLALSSHAGYVPEVLVKKRKHLTNISSKNERVLINRIKMRGKVYGIAKGRDDISPMAKRHFRGRLLSTYEDLARWYLVQGDSKRAGRTCAEGLRIGIRPPLLGVWLLSRMGTRTSRWLLTVYRLGKVWGR